MIKSPKLPLAIFLIAMSGLFSCDRLSKYWAQEVLAPPGWLGPYGFALAAKPNSGLAFGLPVPNSIILFLNFIVLVLIVYLLTQSLKHYQLLSVWGLGLIIIGAISNILDRLHSGFVIDFIHVPFWSIFNLSDVYIVIGAGLFIISNFFLRPKKSNEFSKNS